MTRVWLLVSNATDGDSTFRKKSLKIYKASRQILVRGAHAIRSVYIVVTAVPAKRQVFARLYLLRETRKGAAVRITDKDHVRLADVPFYKSLQEATRPSAAAATHYVLIYFTYFLLLFFTPVGEMRIRRALARVRRLENSPIRFTRAPRSRTDKSRFSTPFASTAFLDARQGWLSRCILDVWIF